MSGAEICFMTATELVQHIRDKTLSVSEVMTAHLAQIERIDPEVNAIPTLLPEQATEFWKQTPTAIS